MSLQACHHTGTTESWNTRALFVDFSPSFLWAPEGGWIEEGDQSEQFDRCREIDPETEKNKYKRVSFKKIFLIFLFFFILSSNFLLSLSFHFTHPLLSSSFPHFLTDLSHPLLYALPHHPFPSNSPPITKKNVHIRPKLCCLALTFPTLCCSLRTLPSLHHTPTVNKREEREGERRGKEEERREERA